ncbi:preprotein translocase subunit YajC [Candidatus Marinimicrobia bacterium MT.SAG.3]|nr:preprotein translocase subunit YajC [Candidatus Neomarinimicrobiota bacterium]TFB09903.1 preprotein translocase subunit YajC [Candidatus Marinimicrobia bacterium MT.SAG.2]TFB12206.1 preprotein translocase subunit YajC [Candidatus Marinimicrobia bacterium MT.SAG.3]
MINLMLLMGQTSEGSGGGGILGLLPFILIFVIFYLLLIRPQMKQQKKKQLMLKELVKGDKVVTVGGLHGTIEGIKEKEEVLILKISDNVKVNVSRSAVVSKKDSKG